MLTNTILGIVLLCLYKCIFRHALLACMLIKHCLFYAGSILFYFFNETGIPTCYAPFVIGAVHIRERTSCILHACSVGVRE